jgi:hypothetical protein
MLQVIRVLHVVSGFIAFFVAPAALVTVKGGVHHRRWGKIYFWSMVVVAISAIVASLLNPNYFLTFVSIFSFYMAFSGYRVLFRKNPREGQGPQAIDWIGASAAQIASLFLIVLGILPHGPLRDLRPVAVVFGVFGSVLGVMDMKSFLYPSQDRRQWWYSHMIGMIGSYIAAVSAFSVTNFHFLPVLVQWLWPSALGIPLIAFWVRYYKQRFMTNPTALMEGRHG